MNASNRLQQVQAIAFDLDGTLVDSITDLAAAANAMRVELGMPPLPQETIRSHVGDGMGRLVHRALTNQRDVLADEALWQQGFAAFVRHYDAHLSTHTRPYPDVTAALALLRQSGLPLAVITNKAERFAVKLLQQLNLDSYFSLIVGGDTLPEKKPSPQPLLHVADVLHLAPTQLAMVGDSRNDILAAKAAGALAVGVDYGYESMAELAQEAATTPDIVISRLSELYDQRQATPAGGR